MNTSAGFKDMESTMTGKTTIRDVAREARVSIGTVSRVLNRKGGNPATCERVMEAARNLNYRSCLFAKGLRASRRGCVGVLIEPSLESADLWLQDFVLEATRFISASGGQALIEFWDPDSPAAHHLLDSVDGCILLGHFPDAFYDQLNERTCPPLVTYDERLPHYNGLVVEVDQTAAMREIVTYLAATGHKKIAFVSAGTCYLSLRARLQAFCSNVTRFTTGPPIVSVSDEPVDWQRRAVPLTRELLASHPDIDAIVFGSDNLAFLGTGALYAAGYSVPEDLSLVGYDNTNWARLTCPSLASAGPDRRELLTALLHGLDFLNGERTQPPALKLTPTFTPRESIRPRNEFSS